MYKLFETIYRLCTEELSDSTGTYVRCSAMGGQVFLEDGLSAIIDLPPQCSTVGKHLVCSLACQLMILKVSSW